MAEEFDVAVIGSGPGGYAAAIRCAQRGASVTVIEKGIIGGTCLNWGCIPSKALLASAQVLISARHAAEMGIEIAEAKPNWDKMQTRKNAIVEGLRRGLTGLLRSNKIRIINGKGIVSRPGRVNIETDNGPTEIAAEKIILATGSEPIELASMPFDGKAILTNKEVLSLPAVPGSLAIVGGGVLGCEMACLYSALGSKVTIIEALEQLLPMEEEWVGCIIERQFKKMGITSITGKMVSRITKTNVPVKIELNDGEKLEAEKVLVSAGRRATCDEETVQGLNLKMNKSAIAVDEKLQSSAEGVYAIGDVTATTFLAHGAFAQADIASINATGGEAKMGDYSLVPRVIYTFPEVASVGKNEKTCIEEGLDITVGRSFFRANGRSLAHNETVGEIRVVREKKTNKILGATMVGSMVTELAAAARALIGTSEEISSIIFPHPTVSEALKEASEDAFGLSVNNPPKR
jgi:dihydrolipoamide dehydrogenase